MNISIIYGENKFRFYALSVLFIGLILNIFILGLNIKISFFPSLIALISLIFFVLSFLKDKNKLITVILSIIVISNLIFIYIFYYNITGNRSLNTLNHIYLNPITFIPLIYFILFILYRIYKINTVSSKNLYGITKKILFLNIMIGFSLIIIISYISLFISDYSDNHMIRSYIGDILGINFLITIIIFILSIISLIKYGKSFILFFVNLFVGVFISFLWFMLAFGGII